MDEQALEPIREEIVDFYGDEIPAALVVINEDGQQVVYVPVRPLVEDMGLSWSGQWGRINRDAVLAEMVQGVRVTRTPEEGGSQIMSCLPLDYINGFLFGINANRARPELRDRIVAYQRGATRYWRPLSLTRLRLLNGYANCTGVKVTLTNG